MEKRSALAGARSLGKKGVEVVGCSSAKQNSGFSSRYCQKKYVYQSPLESVSGYLVDLKKIIGQEQPDVFLPVNEETLLPVLSQREEFEKLLKLPLLANEILEKVWDKEKLTQLVETRGIPCPKALDMTKTFTEPMIARPRKSRVIKNDKIIDLPLKFFLPSQAIIGSDKEEYFFQEYFAGQGFGFCALFDQGKCLAFFMLKRLHEIPFWGGPSSLRESVFEEKLKEYGLRILENLNWHGVAMVEFRQGKDGIFRFIEINPRFWGSLDLAMGAGVDFPWLLVKMAIGEKIEPILDYQKGVKSRWVLGDIAWLKSIWFAKNVLAKRPSRLKSLLEFLWLFFQKTYSDYFKMDDPLPAFVEFWLLVISRVKKLGK